MKNKKVGQILVNVLMVVVIILFSAYTVFNSITGRVIVSGSSMNPTLSNLDYGMMNVSKTKKKNIKRFDIIVFEDQKGITGNGTVLIKRVIGLPGDIININTATGELTVNEKIVLQDFLDSAYVRKTCGNSRGLACGNNFVVPENEYYVLGDNRSNSTDSEHGLGTISKDSILGILWYVDSKCGSIETKTDKNGNSTYVCKDKTSTEIRFF